MSYFFNSPIAGGIAKIMGEGTNFPPHIPRDQSPNFRQGGRTASEANSNLFMDPDYKWSGTQFVYDPSWRDQRRNLRPSVGDGGARYLPQPDGTMMASSGPWGPPPGGRYNPAGRYGEPVVQYGGPGREPRGPYSPVQGPMGMAGGMMGMGGQGGGMMGLIQQLMLRNALSGMMGMGGGMQGAIGGAQRSMNPVGTPTPVQIPGGAGGAQRSLQPVGGVMSGRMPGLLQALGRRLPFSF